MKTIEYGGKTFVVSDRYADALRGYLSNATEKGTARTQFFTIHQLLRDGTSREVGVRINPDDPLFITDADPYYDQYEEPAGTSYELYYLTSWMGKTEMYQGD